MSDIDDYWDGSDALIAQEKRLMDEAALYKKLYEDEQLVSAGLRDQVTAAETQIADLIYECEQAQEASDGVVVYRN